MNDLAREGVRIYANKLIHRTIWIIEMSGGYAAIRLDGSILCNGEHASGVEAQARILAADDNNGIVAIARVTMPKKRQPKRALPRNRGYKGRFVNGQRI